MTDFVGTTVRSVRRRIDTLVELRIVAETAGGRRYRYNSASPPGKGVAELDAEINAFGTGRTDPAE